MHGGSPPRRVLLNTSSKGGEEKEMLWTIIIVLLVLWALGFGVWGATVGPLIHLLLVLAVIVLIVNLITGRRAV
jgi:hypothetical protein